MNSYKELLVYQRSLDLVVKIYQLTRMFPKTETFALSDQLHRAVVSIPSNIAEGFDRKTSKEFYQILQTAYGSSAEVETQLVIASRLNYLSTAEYQETTAEIDIIRKMLHKLMSSIKAKCFPLGTNH